MWAMIAVAAVLLLGGVGGFLRLSEAEGHSGVASPAPTVEPAPTVASTPPATEAANGQGSGANSVSEEASEGEAGKQEVATDTKQVKKEKPKQKVTTAKQTETDEVDPDDDETGMFQPAHPTVPNAPPCG